jgi:uncharacterized protein (UPF0332 family)
VKVSTAQLLAKAERALQAAQTLADAGNTEFATGRAYYAMFHAATALLHEAGLRFSKHGGVHSAVAEHFVKTGRLDARFHRWLIAAFNERIAGDYGVAPPPSVDESRESIRRAAEFLVQARQMLEAR